MTALAIRRHAAVPVLAGLAAWGWFTLWIWERSPYGRYLDHGRWTEDGAAASLCAFLPAGDIIVPVLLYVGGWILMTVAMMLPTILPLVAIFARVTSERRDRALLMTLLVAGYLAVWGAFGTAAHALDWLLHEAAAQSAWVLFNGWMLGAAVVGAAGLFQFSRLKYRCLDKCRAPFSFVAEHWRGKAERLAAFRLGVHHGAFCVGCCWALMLLMFAVGTGNVGWMLLLGAIMAVEKNVSWGRRLARPLGAALIGWSAALVAIQL